MTCSFPPTRPALPTPGIPVEFQSARAYSGRESRALRHCRSRLDQHWGSNNLPIGTKFAINYGGGVKLRKLAGPLGFRIDARGYTATRVFSRAFNMSKSAGECCLASEVGFAIRNPGLLELEKSPNPKSPILNVEISNSNSPAKRYSHTYETGHYCQPDFRWWTRFQADSSADAGVAFSGLGSGSVLRLVPGTCRGVGSRSAEASSRPAGRLRRGWYPQ